jgi:hypothetical protein
MEVVVLVLNETMPTFADPGALSVLPTQIAVPTNGFAKVNVIGQLPLTPK